MLVRPGMFAVVGILSDNEIGEVLERRYARGTYPKRRVGKRLVICTSITPIPSRRT